MLMSRNEKFSGASIVSLAMSDNINTLPLHETDDEAVDTSEDST